MFIVKSTVTETQGVTLTRTTTWGDAPGESSAEYVRGEQYDKVIDFNLNRTVFAPIQSFECVIYDTDDLPDNLTLDDLKGLPVRYLKYFI